ncbi:MAG: restriction endonuclease subunit S [Candidatus Accumulibacter sp.]|jgi:type I restriction enzyme S subunit|nr:restriction endonuclease subunit S [Candidatus Accumulibacter necessarius]
MEVRPGYKQTAVGVVPVDWRVKCLSDVADFLDGRRRPVKDTERAKVQGDIPYYGASGIVDYVNSFLFDEDLILLGEDGENILSRNCRLAFKISGKTWVNNHAHVLRPKVGMALDYLVEFLESRDYAQYNTGTAQPKLNKRVCSGIPVLCPPLSEQRAIAAALSDADALLGGLERLIAKKRDLRQAAMQQLLTGQTRLPGFNGEWVAKRLGALAKIQRGASPRPIDSPVWFDDNSSVGWVRISDVTCSGMFLNETTQRLSPLGVQHSRPVATGSLIMSICATVGRPVITRIDVCIHDGFVVFDDLEADQSFIYYVLKWIEPDWARHGQTGSQMNLNTGLINGTVIKLPPRQEQTAIAAVLSDMDAELSALEARRDKTRALKQGMMQELLTGRVRLISGELTVESGE